MTNKKKTQGLKPWVILFFKSKLEYYLSWWIANLGVVPLFLFSALRLAPLALAFDFLLLLVTAVLETILPLLYRSTNSLKLTNSLNFLPLVWPNVKKLMTLALFFPLFAVQAEVLAKQELILAIGEHRQFAANEVKQFAVTNRQVIMPRFTSKEGLIIKGKMQGFSELIIWSEKGEKRVFSITVLNKREQRQIQWAVGQIQEMGLETKQSGESISVFGIIHTEVAYKQLFKLKKTLPQLQLFVELDSKLETVILGKIYAHFYVNFIDSIKCDRDYLTFVCQVESDNTTVDSPLKKLQEDYIISMVTLPVIPPGQNLKLKIKIIQIEKSDGSEINLGLDQLNAKLKDVIDFGLAPLIEANELLLRKYQLKIESLAEPQMLIQLGQEAKVTLGTEIPFHSQSEQGERVVTNWKFTGLELKIICKMLNGKIIAEYQTNLSSANSTQDGSINGNGQHSQVAIELGTPLELFDISLKGTQEREQYIPLLGEIPFFGRLFKSTNETSVHKKIIAIAEVKFDDK